MVNSVMKGYEMLRLLLSSLPAPLYAFFNLVLGLIILSGLVSLVKAFFGGGD